MPSAKPKPKKRPRSAKKLRRHRPSKTARPLRARSVVKKPRSKKIRVSRVKLDSVKLSLSGHPSLLTTLKLWAKKPIFWAGLGILGLNLALAGGLYLIYEQTVLSFKVVPTVIAQANLRGPQPTRIAIASTQIDLPIVPAQIRDGIWEIPEAAAGHLYTSARPGEGGNIVLYAHNKRQLFGSLPQVKVGDVINLSTDKNTQIDYTVTERLVVSPSQIELVSPTDYEVLTVYTCTGFLDSQRLVLKATPTRVSSTGI